MDNYGEERRIESVRKVVAQEQGEHHTVGLVLEPGNWAGYDPFLLLAEDWFETGTFDVHPHRGIETVTYVIEGELQHFDNHAGNGVLLPGDVQWMTAGSGVIHKEDPAPGQRVHSLQLWVNLPRTDKMTQPRYQNLRAREMPVRNEPGCVVRIFSGSSGGLTAPTINHVPVTMLDITMEPGATLSQDLPSSYNGFLYVLEGQALFGSNRVAAGQSEVLFLSRLEPSDKVSTLSIHATQHLRVLLYAGEPLHEPVAAYGPFVMNTQEEIRQAFEDYRNGSFAK